MLWKQASAVLRSPTLSDHNTSEVQTPSNQDTGFNIGSNNVSSHVEVDADEFSLQAVRKDKPLNYLRTSVQAAGA